MPNLSRTHFDGCGDHEEWGERPISYGKLQLTAREGIILQPFGGSGRSLRLRSTKIRQLRPDVVAGRTRLPLRLKVEILASLALQRLRPVLGWYTIAALRIAGD